MDVSPSLSRPLFHNLSFFIFFFCFLSFCKVVFSQFSIFNYFTPFHMNTHIHICCNLASPVFFLYYTERICAFFISLFVCFFRFVPFLKLKYQLSSILSLFLFLFSHLSISFFFVNFSLKKISVKRKNFCFYFHFFFIASRICLRAYFIIPIILS